MTHVINVDAEPYPDDVDVDMDTDSIEDIQFVIEEYAKLKNLTDPQLISYTRYAS